MTDISEIKLTGGLQPGHVLFNIVGSGPDVIIAKLSKGAGTFLAPERKFSLNSFSIIEGAVIAGGTLDISSQSQVIKPASGGSSVPGGSQPGGDNPNGHFVYLPLIRNGE